MHTLYQFLYNLPINNTAQSTNLTYFESVAAPLILRTTSHADDGFAYFEDDYFEAYIIYFYSFIAAKGSFVIAGSDRNNISTEYDDYDIDDYPCGSCYGAG